MTLPVSRAVEVADSVTGYYIQPNSDGSINVMGGGGGTEYTEDAAAAANPVGTALILIREDARAGSLTNTDGDNVALRGNNKGEAYIKATDTDAILAAIQTAAEIIDDWDESDRAKVNPIAGQAGVAAGAGAVGATVQRMTLASDDPAVAHLANLVSRGVVIRPTITADTNAYTSGDSLFGIVTLSSVMASTGGAAKLKSLCIKDAANQAAAMELYLFRATPAGGTYTANSAVDFDATDWADLLHVISIEAADWLTVDSLAQVSISGLDIMLDSATTDLYLVAVSKGTPTYAADSISMAFGFERA